MRSRDGARYGLILLPGSVLPAEPAYAALLEALGDRVDAAAKDLEVYAHHVVIWRGRPGSTGVERL